MTNERGEIIFVETSSIPRNGGSSSLGGFSLKRKILFLLHGLCTTSLGQLRESFLKEWGSFK